MTQDISPFLLNEIRRVVNEEALKVIAPRLPQGGLFLDIEEGHAHDRLFGHHILPMKSTQALTVSSTTLQDVTELQWDVRKRTAYVFHGFIFAGGPPAGDIKIAIVTPSGTMRWGGFGPALAIASAEASGRWQVTATSGNALAWGVYDAGAAVPLIIGGRIAIGDTEGTVKLQAAQNTADTGTTNIYSSSWFIVHREQALDV